MSAELKNQLIDMIHKGERVLEVKAVIELVGLLFEGAKDNLVAASGDELLRIQGDARTYKNLMRMLRKPAPLTREQ